METTMQLSSYEEILMGIVRALPAERVVQILDYARYIQSQTDGLLNEDETEEVIRADEAHSCGAYHSDGFYKRGENGIRMKSRTVSDFWKLFDNLPSEIQNRDSKAYRQWSKNPFGGSLMFKRVSESEPVYSVRIGKAML